MKKILLILVPFFMFSYEIEFNKKFHHDLPQDILTANISISIADDSEVDVDNRLEVFHKKIKNFDTVEKKFISFNIRPRFRHSATGPVTKGYLGVLKYKVNSDKARYINKFILDVSKLKENRDTSIAIDSLFWDVREDTYNVTLDLLRLEAINWINRYSINLSKDTNKKCNIKKMFIKKIVTNKYIVKKENEVTTSTKNNNNNTFPQTKSNDDNITIDAKYIMECK